MWALQRKSIKRVLSTMSPRPAKEESSLTPGEAFMLKFSRMSTHLANERTLLAWLRTSAAFLSIGLAFAKIDQTEDDIASVAFVRLMLPCACPLVSLVPLWHWL